MQEERYPAWIRNWRKRDFPSLSSKNCRHRHEKGFDCIHSCAPHTLARFKGGIGVIPVSSGVGQSPTAEVVNRNVVRGIQPPGQIWVIEDLRAEVKTNGDISVDGEGLLLGGGDGIGTTGGQSVVATLFCGGQAFSTSPGVPLEPNGDFRIRDTLSPLPLPGICLSPVLPGL